MYVYVRVNVKENIHVPPVHLYALIITWILHFGSMHAFDSMYKD